MAATLAYLATTPRPAVCAASPTPVPAGVCLDVPPNGLNPPRTGRTCRRLGPETCARVTA